MKKLFVLLSALSLSLGAAAQGFGSISEHTSLEISDWFEVNPLSYIYVGLKGPANLKDDQFGTNTTSFGRSQEFGFNLVEFAFHPYYKGTISIGADLDWDYYKLNAERMWVPSEDKTLISTMYVPDFWGKIRQSTLSVMSFNFPLNFIHHFGALALSVGATAEVNLAGIHRFRGTDLAGNDVNNRKSGPYFSKSITTTRFTYDVHAAVAYGGLGLYARYSPVSVLASEGNPHFNTWTLGLILGLDM